MTTITTAQSDDDLLQILALQQLNQTNNIDADVQQSQGFVTFVYDIAQMRTMAAAAPQIIAKDGDRVVGYALTTVSAVGQDIALFKPMFDLMDGLTWHNQPISNQRYYAMGQVCVAESYRGQGIFDALYSKHKELLAGRYDLCITEIAVRNTRSMRAHERVGFQTIHTYRDQSDLWNVVLWDFRDGGS
jgi:ribosomal protein S18 acetylase RimI-like enzyme